MKLFLAYVFLFIFSFQVLPVKEIGKLLFKGTMTEEIHAAHADIDDEDSDLQKQNDPYTPYKPYIQAEKMAVLTSNGLKTSAPQSMSKQFIPDIVTPPPNIG